MIAKCFAIHFSVCVTLNADEIIGFIIKSSRNAVISKENAEKAVIPEIIDVIS